MSFSYDSGIDREGDFDQLSLAGVDFGADYCEDYGITPTNLEGVSMYGSSLDQLGSQYDQMGSVPAGLSGDFEQLGIVPQGMGSGNYQQMGHGNYQQMGSIPSGLGGIMDTWNAFDNTKKMVIGAAALVGALFVAKKMGYIKKLPLIG